MKRSDKRGKDNKKVSTVSTVDVKIVNKVDQDGSKMDTSKEKETKLGAKNIYQQQMLMAMMTCLLMDTNFISL